MSRPGVLVAAALATAATVCMTEAGRRGSPPAPPPERLVRPGTTVVGAVVEDLDGDGIHEVAIASVSVDVGELGIATPYLEVFDVRDGRWTRVFDATGSAPPGAGAPPHMLASGEGFVGQSVQVLEAVDFAADGRPELVVGIANFGASAGPLELWIVSVGDGGLVTALYRASARGGDVAVEGDRLRFEYGVYRRNDPGCCPSRIAVETIGWDPVDGAIEVLSRRRTGSE
jgi:hypothetical protein